MAYYKPQSPLKKGDDYFYPLTHISQVITEDGGRLNNELGLKMDLLWTNASPTSAFAPQTVSLDLSNYRLVFISGYENRASSSTCAGMGIVGGMGFLLGLTENNYARFRAFNCNVNGITFGGGAYPTATGDNGSAVPWKIWGVR